jgi:uncharacterized protein
VSERWRTCAGTVRIGVLSDTHGLLTPAVQRSLLGVDHIIHAGDVGDPGVIEQLRRIAPVTAVAGNMDAGLVREVLPEEAAGDVRGVRYLVGHRQSHLLRHHSDPAREGFDLVVVGHTHRPDVDWLDGVLYLNPGTASVPLPGRRASVAVVEVDVDGLDPRIIDLD